MARQHHQSQNPSGLPTKGVQFTGQAGRNLLSGCMESPHALRQRVDREVQFKNRLHLAATRLKDANRERIWAVVAAHKAGLSIRQIAKATALSSSRVHQLLHDNEAREIPDWRDDLRAWETEGACKLHRGRSLRKRNPAPS